MEPVHGTRTKIYLFCCPTGQVVLAMDDISVTWGPSLRCQKHKEQIPDMSAKYGAPTSPRLCTAAASITHITAVVWPTASHTEAYEP
jgi:hypothetical protein